LRRLVNGECLRLVKCLCSYTDNFKSDTYLRPMKKLLFSAAALAVLFTACKSDDDTQPTPQVINKFFLNAVSEEDSVSATYNAANKVDRFDQFFKDGGENYQYFWYSQAVYENGKMTKVMGSEKDAASLQQSQAIIYDASGRVQKLNFYSFGTSKVDSYDSLGYDGNGRLSYVWFADAAGDNAPLVIYKKTALVWDANGNIGKTYDVRIVDGAETTDTVKTSYTYDDKVNFKSKQPEFLLMNSEGAEQSLSAHNVLTSERVEPTYSLKVTNTYTYDEENYPVTIKVQEVEVSNGEEVHNSTLNYKIRYIKK